MSVATSPTTVSNATSRSCEHCGLSTRRAAEVSGLAFCCHGCRGAHELIHQWGLEAYYDLRDVGDGGAIDASVRSYEDLDDPRLLGRSAPQPMRSMVPMVPTENVQENLRCKLSIEGLHCAACVWLLEQAPRRMPGWVTASVHSHDRTIELVYDPRAIRLSEIGRCLDRLGYHVAPMAEATLEETRPIDSQGLLVDIAVAGFCAANAMWVAIAIYAGSFTGIDPSHASILRTAGVLLGAVAVVFPGRAFFRGAWASLAMRTPHMDLPVAIGLGAGLIASLYALFDSRAEVYFDSIASLVFFLLVGRWFQMRQQRRAGDEVAGLLRMAPRAANRIGDDGSIERVAVDALRVGDRVLVGASESVPIDGTIVEGSSLIDRSLLTGESKPVAVSVDDAVEAGTDNVRSTITVLATAVGGQTRLAGIQSAVAGAAAARTPIVQLANRIGGWFVVVVLLLAIGTAGYWAIAKPERAVPNSVALLIVACPCALALATPLAMAVVIGRLARRRILIRSGEAMERLSRPGTIFFDKTGTLTAGRMTVTHWAGDDRTLQQVAAVERTIVHPIARSLVEFAEMKRVDAPEFRVDGVDQLPGLGIVASVDGQTVRIGNWTHVCAHVGCRREDVQDRWPEEENLIRQKAATPIWVAIDGVVAAVAGVADEVRGDAASVIESVRRWGWDVAILSGDDPVTVRRVGAELAVAESHCFGGLLPEDKLSAVRDASRRGAVMMVGDGINDAAALAAADVGVAMRGGASASLTAAPVMIADGKLSGILSLIDGARGLRRLIVRNFAVSIAYNAFAVGLAMTGWISPLIAAVLMPLSSVSVIAMTLASGTFKETSA